MAESNGSVSKPGGLGTKLGLYLLAGALVAYTGWAVSETGAVLPALLLVPGLALLLPFSRERLKIKPSLGISAIVAAIFLVAIGLFAGMSKADAEKAAQLRQQQESAARIAKSRADRTAEYAKNKLQIIAEVEQQLANNQAREAAVTISKFMTVTKDPDLGRLQYRAEVQVMKLDLQQNEANLPPERRAAIYSTLMREDPGGRTEYERKLTEVETRLAQDRKAQEDAAQRVALEAKLKSQFSAWDGSHRNVEAAIKKRLKDPGSYEHVETRYVVNPSSIRVFTTYRARNSFNALVPGTAVADVDQDGNVLSLN